jgi:hypothetical protein
MKVKFSRGDMVDTDNLGIPPFKIRVPLAIKALSEERIVYIACGGSTSAVISGEI